MNKSKKQTESDGYKLAQLGPKTRNIPLHWDVRKLGNISNINMGSSPKSEYYNEEGEGLPFFQGNADFGAQHPQVTVWCTNPNKTADEDDLLLSVRAPVGDLNIATEHCCIGRGLAAISGDEADNGFLYYLLSFEKSRLQTYAQGSTFKSVNSGVLNNFPVQFPPLSEQRRIADILSTVDEEIQQTDEMIEKTRELKHGLMKELLHEGIGHSEFKEMYIGPKRSTIPAEWEVVSLDEIADIQSGSTPKRGDEEYWKNGTIPWVKSGEFNDRVVENAEEKITEKALDETGCTVFPQDTLLIALYGKGTVSKTARLGMDAATNQAIAGLLPKDDSFDPRYLQYYLIDSRNTLLNVTVNPSSDTGRTNIYLSALRKFKVPLPPIEEQRTIADRISVVDGKIADEKETKQHLQELKRGLMQDLLTGKVRVNTD